MIGIFSPFLIQLEKRRNFIEVYLLPRRGLFHIKVEPKEEENAANVTDVKTYLASERW